MKDSTERWIKKSDGNFRSMKALFALEEEGDYDTVCYLSQQCIEKLLKALCIERGIFFPHSHDLTKLVQLLVPNYATLKEIEPELVELTRLGADFRYPDDFATRFEANRAVELCTRVRTIIRALLGPVEGMLFP